MARCTCLEYKNDACMQFEAKHIAPYPKINNIWDRITFEAGFVFNLVSQRGLKAHDADRYVSTMISIARHICLEAPGLSPEARRQLEEGLEEADRLLDRFYNPPPCSETSALLQ